MNSACSAGKFLYYPDNFCWFFGRELPKVATLIVRLSDPKSLSLTIHRDCLSPFTPSMGFPGWGVNLKLEVKHPTGGCINPCIPVDM